MERLVGLLRRGQRLSLVSARTSQTLVIATTDRVARNADTGQPRVLGRVWAAQLNLVGILAGEPVSLADEAHLHVKQLIALHQEFVHRLFEAIDTRDLLTASDPVPSNVIAMPTRCGT